MSVFNIDRDELKTMAPEKAIEILLDAFYKSQADKIRARREEAGLDADEDTIRNSTKKAIDRAFHEIGSDSGNPDTETILKVVDFIEDQAKNW